MIHVGDCVTVMRTLPADSVDAVVTDPPYGLEFMGKAWDQFKTGRSAKYSRGGQLITTEQIAERSGKGGAGPSYVQRPAIRCIACGKQAWSGSPCKCEKPEWREDNSPLHAFQAWCQSWGTEALRVTKPGGYLLAFGGTRTHHRLVCGLEDAGWIIRDELTWVYASGFPKGKANLKPAHEPIVLARKPGPLRPLGIDAGRIDTNGEAIATHHGTGRGTSMQGNVEESWPTPYQPGDSRVEVTAGRWPSNVLLSDPALFDEPNPEVVGSGATAGTQGGHGRDDTPQHAWMRGLAEVHREGFGDTGGYSRFFIVPKSSRSDREPVITPDGHDRSKRFSTHPTQKPTDLMAHLIKLVCPPDGVILDPFLGSGSTAVAAEREGVKWIGIEKEPEYVAIAEARLNGTQRGLGLDVGAPTRRQTKPGRPPGRPTTATNGQAPKGWSGGWGSDEEPVA